MNSQNYKVGSHHFLDLSGFTFSGKHAVIELVREFDGFSVPHFEDEFLLIRVQDGISDLENALVADWSPVRCHAAIARFIKLIEICDRKATRTRIGYDYSARYNGNFRRLAEIFLTQIIDVKWDAKWPFAWHHLSTFELIKEKILAKLNISNAFESTLYLASGKNFNQKVREFLEPLLTLTIPKNCHTVVLHNAIEPYNPLKGLNYFTNAQSINVYRDPRDNYIAAVTHSPLYKKIAGADSVDTFIRRYRLLMQYAEDARIDPVLVKRIQYEDLIFNYEKTVAEISEFLGKNRVAHSRKLAHFNPEFSRKFVGMWKNFKDQKAIKRIEKDLCDFCVEYS